MKLREIMTQNVRSCRPDTPLTEVARIMADINVGIVPVVDGDKVVGMITDRDIVLRTLAEGQDPKNAVVRDCMTSPAVTIGADEDAHKAASLMSDKQIRRLPVVEGGRIVGIVSLGDLATERIHVDEAGEALSSISEASRPGAH